MGGMGRRVPWRSSPRRLPRRNGAQHSVFGVTQRNGGIPRHISLKKKIPPPTLYAPPPRGGAGRRLGGRSRGMTVLERRATPISTPTARQYARLRLAAAVRCPRILGGIGESWKSANANGSRGPVAFHTLPSKMIQNTPEREESTAGKGSRESHRWRDLGGCLTFEDSHATVAVDSCLGQSQEE